MKQLPGDELKFANLLILLAWGAGELSEGQAIAALQMPRVQARELKESMIQVGVKLHGLMAKQCADGRGRWVNETEDSGS